MRRRQRRERGEESGAESGEEFQSLPPKKRKRKQRPLEAVEAAQQRPVSGVEAASKQRPGPAVEAAQQRPVGAVEAAPQQRPDPAVEAAQQRPVGAVEAAPQQRPDPAVEAAQQQRPVPAVEAAPQQHPVEAVEAAQQRPAVKGKKKKKQHDEARVVYVTRKEEHVPCKTCHIKIRKAGMNEHVARMHGKDWLGTCPKCPWVHTHKGAEKKFIPHWTRFHSGECPPFQRTELLSKEDRVRRSHRWAQYRV